MKLRNKYFLLLLLIVVVSLPLVYIGNRNDFGSIKTSQRTIDNFKKIKDGSNDQEIIVSSRDMGRAYNDSVMWEVEKGDIEAYKTMAITMKDFIPESKRLYFSIQFANKYGDPEACWQVFDIITSSEYSRIEFLKSANNTTRTLAFFYLMKSFKGGHTSAKFMVDEILMQNKFLNLEQLDSLNNRITIDWGRIFPD